MDPKAWVHTVGAFILFINVGYFCLIGFLRSLNQKLMELNEIKGNGTLMTALSTIRSAKSNTSLPRFQKFWYRLLPETCVFLAIAKDALQRFDQQAASQSTVARLPISRLAARLSFLWNGYTAKIRRGYIYVFTGSLIVLVLIASLPVGLFLPAFATQAKLTFVIETISLLLFGLAWVTASQLRFFRKLHLMLALRQKKQTLVAEPSQA